MILLWLAAHPWAAVTFWLCWTIAWAAGGALWGRALGRDQGYDEGYEDGLRDAAPQVSHTVTAPIYLPPVPLALPPAESRPQPTAEADERVAGPATSASLYMAAELNHLLQAIPEDWRKR